MSNPIEQFVGKNIYGSVGEPWDFESDAGKNVFLGKIQSVEENTKGDVCALCLVSPFYVKAKKIEQVVAIPRHHLKQSPLTLLLEGDEVVCNFYYSANGSLLTPGNAVDFLEKSTEFNFLVGSIRLT